MEASGSQYQTVEVEKGVPHSMHFGPDYRASLITRRLWEMNASN
jgi:hypothetical protein